MLDEHDHTDTEIAVTLPKGYMLRPDGVYRTLSDGNHQHICGPIWLKALGRLADGDGWTKIFIFDDRDGVNKEVRLATGDLVSAAKAAVALLSKQGFWIAPGAAKDVAQLLEAWETDARVELHPNNGWLGDDYATYALVDGTVIGDTSRVSTAARDKDTAPSGNIGSWRDEVAARCEGNPLAILAVSYALAAPLLKMLVCAVPVPLISAVPGR